MGLEALEGPQMETDLVMGQGQKAEQQVAALEARKRFI